MGKEGGREGEQRGVCHAPRAGGAPAGRTPTEHFEHRPHLMNGPKYSLTSSCTQPPSSPPPAGAGCHLGTRYKGGGGSIKRGMAAWRHTSGHATPTAPPSITHASQRLTRHHRQLVAGPQHQRHARRGAALGNATVQRPLSRLLPRLDPHLALEPACSVRGRRCEPRGGGGVRARGPRPGQQQRDDIEPCSQPANQPPSQQQQQRPPARPHQTAGPRAR